MLCKLLCNHEQLCCYGILRISAGDREVWEEGESGLVCLTGMTAPTPNNIQTLNDTPTRRQSLLGWLRGERAMPIDQMELGLNPAVLLPSKSVTRGKWKSPGPQCSQMSTGGGGITISDSEDSMRKCISQAFQSA